MRSLVDFFIKYGIILFFLLLEGISFFLVVKNNYFQRSSFYTSFAEVSNRLFLIREGVSSYFRLGSTNEQLAQENVELRNRVFELQNQVQMLKGGNGLRTVTIEYPQVPSADSDSIKKRDPKLEFTCFSARVINNTTGHLQNYITLNRGYSDGIREDMSVISAGGVVGVVMAVSDHFSIVMPVLNSKMQISCKILADKKVQESLGNIKDIGSLVWPGGNPEYATMTNVPRHVPIKKGDIVVTSGYSDFFPEGIRVGSIEEFHPAEDDNYFDIKVRLSVKFSALEYVEVLNYKNRAEQAALEAKTRTEEK